VVGWSRSQPRTPQVTLLRGSSLSSGSKDARTKVKGWGLLGP
jgi:hypothetical protein